MRLTGGYMRLTGDYTLPTGGAVPSSAEYTRPPLPPGRWVTLFHWTDANGPPSVRPPHTRHHHYTHTQTQHGLHGRTGSHTTRRCRIVYLVHHRLRTWFVTAIGTWDGMAVDAWDGTAIDTWDGMAIGTWDVTAIIIRRGHHHPARAFFLFSFFSLGCRAVLSVLVSVLLWFLGFFMRFVVVSFEFRVFIRVSILMFIPSSDWGYLFFDV
ncbi:hypothetical protein BJ138DRAFT_542464 [Hygrophoropsis aurantiaca]|uniref:Uncharacterized protein n=1 Tax=Hygrophoropsis aurantiaca TaxID=72124 RepID=A0ACB8A1F3_9AGAM|nr:hypothetical protein BJ138DRAFT_542464 [Hygrophoropsis aurantiaca]